MMAGLLFARAGHAVVVLEKHGDFLRDFRGDTIHPSTLQVMHELGLLEALLRLPHQRVPRIAARIGAATLPVADMSRLPVRCPFIAMMPQWEFLNFLAEEARRHHGFSLAMGAEATDVLVADGRVVGVRSRAESIRADLVIAADGRHSIIRERVGLAVEDLGAPIDVLWFRLPKSATDDAATVGRFSAGAIVVQIDRGDYWQCAFVIPKDGAEALRAEGLPAFRARIAALAPELADRLDVLAGWDDVKLLSVQVNRLRRWHRPGLLCIGDAAHAMSPVGGVGINLAIQDAVAAANLLVEPLRRGPPGDADLARVQARRSFPTRATQRLQLLVQNRILGRVLRADAPVSPPFLLRLVARRPALQRLPGRLVGLGFRPEHVRVPAVPRP
jgi:2-polyprenyl-6-methoxyphenol hydroxylase-like FAD-dependent oxidoreductase